MRSEKEITQELERIQEAVNQGVTTEGEIIWDTLRWVLDPSESETPVDRHVDSDVL